MEVNKEKELKELEAILALVKPNLEREEFTPLANAMYKLAPPCKRLHMNKRMKEEIKR